MSPERRASQETARRTTAVTTNLRELGVLFEDTGRLNVADAPLTIQKSSFISGVDEFTATWNLPLGPAELRTLLKTSAGSQKDGEALEDFRTPRAMQYMYESFALGANPTSPGHCLADLEQLRMQAIPVLRASSERPDEMTLFTLSQLEQVLRSQHSLTPREMKKVFDLPPTTDPEYYKRLLKACNLEPKSTKNPKTGEAEFNPMQQKNNIIDKFLDGYLTLSTVLDRLPEDKDVIAGRFGLLRYGGYIETDVDQSPIIVFSSGSEHEIEDGKIEGIQYQMDNFNVNGRLDKVLTPYGRAYSLTPREATMIDYLTPQLRWSRHGSLGFRQWQLEPSSDCPHETQPRTAPLLGLVTLAYMEPTFRNYWRQDVPNQELLTPSYIPSLVAIRQGDLLEHPLLPAIEGLMEEKR